jgi:hypothetical protein
MSSAWIAPDWLDQAKYREPKTTADLQFAWEFLRRNPDYQKLWEEQIAPEYDPAELDQACEAEKRIAPGRVDRPRLNTPFTEQFHIATYPPPPPSENEAKLLFDLHFIPYQRRAGRTLRGTLEENEIVVRLNLTWPLQQQIANVKKLFENQIKERGIKHFQKRRRFEKYQLYLRLLDAKAVGADDEQIIKALYSKVGSGQPDDRNPRQRMRDDLKAAKRLRDHDFWLIAVTAKK